MLDFQEFPDIVFAFIAVKIIVMATSLAVALLGIYFDAMCCFTVSFKITETMIRLVAVIAHVRPMLRMPSHVLSQIAACREAIIAKATFVGSFARVHPLVHLKV